MDYIDMDYLGGDVEARELEEEVIRRFAMEDVEETYRDDEEMTELEESKADQLNTHLRNLTGKVEYQDPLVLFLYLLARDHLPAGSVEELLIQTEACRGDSVVYTNGYLARYAKYVADVLRIP